MKTTLIFLSFFRFVLKSWLSHWHASLNFSLYRLQYFQVIDMSSTDKFLVDNHNIAGEELGRHRKCRNLVVVFYAKVINLVGVQLKSFKIVIFTMLPVQFLVHEISFFQSLGHSLVIEASCTIVIFFLIIICLSFEYIHRGICLECGWVLKVCPNHKSIEIDVFNWF